MIDDMSKKQGLGAHIHGSKMIKRCPTCTEDYKEKHIKVIEQHIDSAVMHITCQGCKQSVIAVLGETNMGVGLVGLVTDLTLEDTTRFHRREPFSQDDLLEFVESLHSKKFTKLITK